MRDFTEATTIKDCLTAQPEGTRQEGARQVSHDKRQLGAVTCKFYLQVRQAAGLGKVHQLFGDKLNTVFEELNEALAA